MTESAPKEMAVKFQALFDATVALEHSLAQLVLEDQRVTNWLAFLLRARNHDITAIAELAFVSNKLKTWTEGD